MSKETYIFLKEIYKRDLIYMYIYIYKYGIYVK